MRRFDYSLVAFIGQYTYGHDGPNWTVACFIIQQAVALGCQSSYSLLKLVQATTGAGTAREVTTITVSTHTIVQA